MNASTIKDELTESIQLKNVRVLLSEYIPCDRNILESIGKKIMSGRETQGEFVTMLMDEVPESTIFTSEKMCNSIRVIDSLPTEYITCEASIQDPTDVEVEQKEQVGIYLSHDGHIIYGAHITEVDGKLDISKDGVSLDKLARIIIDLSYDTSLMMDTLLTQHQRRLMECVYKGTSSSRYKFVGILAENIEPHFDDPEDYMDDEEYQNELEQILDDLVFAHKNERDGSIILSGESGIMVTSKSCEKYESVVTYYSLLRGSEIFVNALFDRVSLLWDELADVRKLIDKTTEGDHTVITKAQNILTDASANFTIIKSIGGYLTRGFELIHEGWKDESTKIDAEILSVIDLESTLYRIVSRINDAEIDLKSLESEVEGLQTLLSTQIEQQMRRVYSALRDNTRSTTEVIRASERTGNVLDVIELILSGTIAFDIVFALTGEYVTEFALFPTENPVLFFTLAIGLWGVIVIALKKSMDWLESKVEKSHLTRITLNAKCSIEKLEAYIDQVETVSIDEELQKDRSAVRVTYHYKSPFIEGETKVTISYDRRNAIIQDVIIETSAMDVTLIKNGVIEKLRQTCLMENQLAL